MEYIEMINVCMYEKKKIIFIYFIRVKKEDQS